MLYPPPPPLPMLFLATHCRSYSNRNPTPPSLALHVLKLQPYCVGLSSFPFSLFSSFLSFSPYLPASHYRFVLYLSRPKNRSISFFLSLISWTNEEWTKVKVSRQRHYGRTKDNVTNDQRHQSKGPKALAKYMDIKSALNLDVGSNQSRYCNAFFYFFLSRLFLIFLCRALLLLVPLAEREREKE